MQCTIGIVLKDEHSVLVKWNGVARLTVEPSYIPDVKLGNLKVLTSGSDVYNMISWTSEGVIPGYKMLQTVV